jgi:hypothetical protein
MRLCVAIPRRERSGAVVLLAIHRGPDPNTLAMLIGELHEAELKWARRSLPSSSPWRSSERQATLVPLLDGFSGLAEDSEYVAVFAVEVDRREMNRAQIFRYGGHCLASAGISSVGALKWATRAATRTACAYDHEDARRIVGRKSSELSEILGYRGDPELIHRDDMVLHRRS